MVSIPVLIIDSSEAGTDTGGRVKEYFEKHGHSIMIKLAQADYVWANKDGKTVCVERTTPGDLWGKITSGRLFEQLESELESCDVLYYVIANYKEYGYLLKMASRDIDSSFTGAVTSISRVAHLVPIWHSYKFPHWLLLTFEKEVGLREPGKVGRTPRKKERSPRSVAIDMLVALPHVGVARAEDMVQETCSIRELLLRIATQPLQFLSRHLPLKHAKELDAIINYDYCKFKEDSGNNKSEG